MLVSVLMNSKILNEILMKSKMLNKSSNIAIDLTYKGKGIKEVQNFRYLRSEITADSRWHTEIIKRIALAKNTVRKMSPILTNNNTTLQTRSRVLKYYVWSTLL